MWKPWVQMLVVLLFVSWTTWQYIDGHAYLWDMALAYMVLGVALERGHQYLRFRGVIHWHEQAQKW
jgi:hypothetical protein